MEILKHEIKKISKKFMIPEKDIINFLADEERQTRISFLKKLFLEEKNEEKNTIIFKNWLNECKNFCDFEDIYVTAESQHITENFFLDWLKACNCYQERRTVYSCLDVKKPAFINIFIGTWIDLAYELEDIREAISHVERDSVNHRKGIKKITDIYKK